MSAQSVLYTHFRMPLTISPAVESDVPLILSFIRKLAEYEKLAHDFVATEDGLRQALFSHRPYAEVVLAYQDGTPAGFALFFHNFSTFWGRPGIYLEDLFVDPEQRGKGIGKALLAHVAKVAVERGCSHLQWAVLDWNEPSIRFYKSLGAEPKDEWTLYRLSGDALKRVADSNETQS